MHTAYFIKKEVADTGKPFRHIDKTWYVVDKNGSWRRLIKMGSKFFYKNGQQFIETPLQNVEPTEAMTQPETPGQK